MHFNYRALKPPTSYGVLPAPRRCGSFDRRLPQMFALQYDLRFLPISTHGGYKLLKLTALCHLRHPVLTIHGDYKLLKLAASLPSSPFCALLNGRVLTGFVICLVGVLHTGNINPTKSMGRDKKQTQTPEPALPLEIPGKSYQNFSSQHNDRTRSSDFRPLSPSSVIL